MFEVGPENVMPVLDLLQRGMEFSLQLFGDTAAEDLADLVRREPPQPDLAGTLEDAVDREIPLEDELRQYSIWLTA